MDQLVSIMVLLHMKSILYKTDMVTRYLLQLLLDFSRQLSFNNETKLA